MNAIENPPHFEVGTRVRVLPKFAWPGRPSGEGMIYDIQRLGSQSVWYIVDFGQGVSAAYLGFMLTRITVEPSADVPEP